MQPSTFELILDRAAAECGIDPGYWDIWGQRHETSSETKQAILGAMGIAAGDSGELADAMEERTRREWKRLSPPAVLATEGDTFELYVHLASDDRTGQVRLIVRRENGGVSEHEIGLREMTQSASMELDGHTWVRFQAKLPVALPLGYHDVTVEAGSRKSETRYIVTPHRAWIHPHLARGGRAAGIAVSLYGVRSARNWGCGDFTDLHAVIDWVADELERPSSRSIRCTRSTTAGLSTPVPIFRTASSTGIFCTWTWKRLRTSSGAGARGCYDSLPR